MISVKEAQKISEKAKPVAVRKDVLDELEELEKAIKRKAGKGDRSVRYQARNQLIAEELFAELSKMGYVMNQQGNLLSVEW